MHTLNFCIDIHAPKEKVWETLWNDDTYRKWTSVFSPTSYAESDWKEGSKVLFLDGSGSGMVSRIETLRPNEFMSFRHEGDVKHGVEDTTSEKVKDWQGAHENYTLRQANGITTLLVDVDVVNSFKEYMLKTFPLALQKVKALCEPPGAQKVTPFLWFNNNLEEAMNFYVSVFKNARIISIDHLPNNVVTGTFEIEGQLFHGLNGGPMFKFTEAISLMVNCETQEEVDELYNKLLEGGEEQMCGWLKDKFGLSWQIVPKRLEELTKDKDPEKAGRVMQAMMQMKKIEIAKLEEAYNQQ